MRLKKINTMGEVGVAPNQTIDPAKRTKTILEAVDNNTSTSAVKNVDEKHKQMCNRILGGDFENNLLFVKVQEGSIQAHSIQSVKEKILQKNFKNAK